MKTSNALFVMAMAAASLAGCTNLDGSANRTGTGALIGAGTGALIGNAIDGGTTGRIVGGAVGAIAGGTIGAALDQQHRQLTQDLQGSGATVVNTGSQLVVTLPSSITFDTGSAVVQPVYVTEIAKVARSLNDNPASTVLVVGHTDNVGSAAYNQGLSERRAASVAQVLTSNGVAAARVGTAGRGFDQPVASNDTPGGRAQNRRVEIIITPTTGA